LRVIDIDYVHGHGGLLAVAPHGEIDGCPDADPFELVRQVERAGGGDEVALRPLSGFAPRRPARSAVEPGRTQATTTPSTPVGVASAETMPMPAVGIRPLDELGNNPAHGVDRNGNPSAVLGALS
jgi:hypothetical protein